MRRLYRIWFEDRLRKLKYCGFALTNSLAPISWPAAAMRYGDDFNPGRSFTADDQERETAENITSPGAEYAPPARGRLQNFCYSLIEFSNELISGTKTPTPIPLDCRSQF
jgi:hypothetical protein